MVSVNTASMTADEAAGTSYDGATPLLSASTPVTPGAHTLYLSIFDQGDNVYDSAVFVDRLVLGTTGEGGCQPGATVVTMDKDVDDSTVQPGDTVTYTVTVTNNGDDDAVLDSITDTLPAGFVYVPESTTGITTDEPSIDGQDLTWEGPFTVPGEAILLGSIDLSFSATVSTELPGTYYNNASAQGDGISVTPTGPDAPVTVEAAATGNIVVVKHTDPDGDPQEFSFTTDYTDPFSLSDGEQNDSGDLAAGTYSVSESVPEGWELTSATCDDGSDPSEIGLDDGETVICTFNNTKQGNIVVVKQTNPDGDPQEFGFTTELQRSVLALGR